MIKKVVLSVLLPLFIPAFMWAQDNNGQMWLGLEVDWYLGDKWSFYINPEYYTLYTGGDRWYEAAFIAGLTYSPTPAFSFWGGFYTSYILQTENEDTYEFRPRVGGRWNITRSDDRFYFRLQSEYEWRLFWNLNDKIFSRSNRIRVRPDMLVSLNRANTIEDNNVCLRVYGEYFQNLDRNIEERFWNRYGTALGLYYRLNSKWRYELRYLLQGSRNTKLQTRPSTVSHILYLYVTYVIP